MVAGHDHDEPTVLEALASGEAEVRARALGAAERAGLRTVAVRVAALGDQSGEVRRRAARLEARRPRRSRRVEAALRVCLDDADPLVVAAAADALGESASVDAVTDLSGIAVHHPDPRCREAAVAALGSLGFADGLDAVLAALEDKPAVRRRAVVALAAFDSPLVDAALERACTDRDWQVRQAAEALRDSGR